MTEWTAIRVSKVAKESADDSKRDNETWDDYLQRCTDNPPELREFVDTDAVNVDTVTLDASERTAIAREVAEVLRE